MSNEEIPRQQVVEEDQEQNQSEQVSVQLNTSAEQTNSQQIEELTNKYHACQVELNALKERLTQIIQENSCPICLFPWKEQGAHRLVSLRCGHLFGDVCIRRWMSQNLWCPICRQEGQITDLRYIFGRRILPCPVHQDQAVQPSQLEQSSPQRHASRVQQTLNRLVQLARRSVSELQTSVELAQPGQQETLLQQRYLAVQQALYNVEEMAKRMLLVVQSLLRGQHPGPHNRRHPIEENPPQEAEGGVAVPMVHVARPLSRPVSNPPEANQARQVEVGPGLWVRLPANGPLRRPAGDPAPQNRPAPAEPMRFIAHRHRRRRVRDPGPAARMPLIGHGPRGQEERMPLNANVRRLRRYSVG